MRKKKPAPQRDLFGDLIVPGQSSQPATISTFFRNYFVRVIMIKGEPWWVLSDVSRILGYRDATHAKRELRDRHKGYTRVCTPGGSQEMMIISEGGLMRLMMRSDGEVAEAFQDWVTDEVLPQIRRTGTYSPKGGRITKEARRLKCDDGTAFERVEQFTINKQIARDFAADGACPRDLQMFHNGVSTGLFGNTVKGVRGKLEQKSYRETPLDKMDRAMLSVSSHAKTIAAVKIKELGPDLPFAARAKIAEDIARKTASEALTMLGPDHYIGLYDDPTRGKIIAALRGPLSLPGPDSAVA